MNRRAFSIPRAGLAVALVLVVLAAVLTAGCTSQSGPTASVLTPGPVAASASTLAENVTVRNDPRYASLPLDEMARMAEDRKD